MEPNVLPADLAPVEHLMDPSPDWPWILAAAVAAWILRALWKRRSVSPPRPSSPGTRPTAPRPSTAVGIIAQIEALRERRHDDYRRGCHELAELLREHMGRQSGQIDYTILTAREIARTLGENALSRVFLLLADLQFGRDEPGQSDFHGICDLASETWSDTEKIP